MTNLHISLDDIPELNGKVAIVTGGSNGIGLAITRLLLQKKAKVVIADLSPPKDPLSESIYVQTNVAEWSNLVHLFDAALAEYGQIDFVFPNAGLRAPEDTFSDKYDDDGYLLEPDYKSLQVNLIGLLNTVKLSIHHLRKAPRGGSITFTSSKAGYSAVGGPIYTTSKHGTIGMLRSLSRFLPQLNIRLNSVAPGFTRSGLVSSSDYDHLEKLGVYVQDPSVVALAAVYLASNGSSHAETIQVTGGKFREIESGYVQASDIMFGDSKGGRPWMSPEAGHLEAQSTLFAINDCATLFLNIISSQWTEFIYGGYNWKNNLRITTNLIYESIRFPHFTSPVFSRPILSIAVIEKIFESHVAHCVKKSK